MTAEKASAHPWLNRGRSRAPTRVSADDDSPVVMHQPQGVGELTVEAVAGLGGIVDRDRALTCDSATALDPDLVRRLKKFEVIRDVIKAPEYTVVS